MNMKFKMGKIISVYGLLVLIFLPLIVSSNAQGINVWKKDAGETTIVIEWDAPEAGEKGYYKVWRDNVDDLETRELVRVLNFPVHQYTDHNITSSSKYNYTIEKYDNQDNPLDSGYTIACSLGRVSGIDWTYVGMGIFIIVFIIILALSGVAGQIVGTTAGKGIIILLLVLGGTLFSIGVASTQLVSPC